MNYLVYTPKQAKKQTLARFLLNCRLSLFVFLLLVMMIQISTATVPVLQVASPSICERGAIEFSRSGNFGMQWDWDYTPPPIDSVWFYGYHNFEIRKFDGTVVHSYSQYFHVTVTNIINCGANSRCAYVPFGDVLSSSQMNSVIQNLAPDNYYAFWWSDYTWYQFFQYLPSVFGNNQEGSSTSHTNWVYLSEDDLAFPIDVNSTEINGISTNVYPVYECNNTVPVLFHVDKVQGLLGNQYKVNSQWAEVTSCNQGNLIFSDPKESSLHIVYENNEPQDILRLTNLLHTDVFDGSPFINTANIGKRYRLRFTLFNDGNSCPEEIVNICVVFTGEAEDIDFYLQSCGDSGNPDCEFGYVEASASAPGPTLGYNSPNIQITSAEGIFEKYIYKLTHIDGSNETCLGYNLLNVLPQQYVTSNTITVNMNNWEIGGNTNRFPHYAANDILQFKLELFLINTCTRCLDGSEEVQCDFSSLDACDYDDLDELIVEFDVVKGEMAFAISYFNIEPNTPNKPFHQDLWANQMQDFQEKTISIVPNPFSSNFDIIGADVEGQFNIFDLNGKLLFYKIIDKNETLSINMQPLASGMYIYHFVSKSGEITSNKLIKY
jgi:hypothetical protein